MADEKHQRRETGNDLELEDLEVGVTEDAAEQVKGGATRVQGTVKWFNGEKPYGAMPEPPTQQ